VKPRLLRAVEHRMNAVTAWGSVSGTRPDGGCVEFGYGLAPSARDHVLRRGRSLALLATAVDNGLSRVITETAL
jgi:hypothetical protein